MRTLTLNEDETEALRISLDYLNYSEKSEDYNGETDHILYYIRKLEKAFYQGEYKRS